MLSTLRRSNTVQLQKQPFTISNKLPVRSVFSRSSLQDAHVIESKPEIKLDDILHGLADIPKDLNGVYQRWLQQFRSCIQILQNPDPVGSVDKTQEIEEITKCWLDNFYEYNLEQEADNFTLTDLLFMIRCFLLACTRGFVAREVMEFEHLSVLFNKVVILSCMHNSQASVSFPDAKSLESLENQMISFIIQHYFSTVKITEIASRLRAEFVIIEKKQKQQQQQKKQQQQPQRTEFKYVDLDEMNTPLTQFELLSPELETIKRQLFIRNETQPNANLGWLWNQSGIEMYSNFIPLCTRVFSHIIREQQLLQAYPMKELPSLPPNSLELLHKWLIAECAVDAEDDLRLRFAEISHELQIPMGGRLFYQRRKVTRNNVPTSVTVLEDQLGYDTSSRLSEMAKTKPQDVCQDPKHDLYNSLLLTMMDLRFTQRKRTSLLTHFVILPTQLADLHKHKYPYKQFATEKHYGQVRAPLLALMQKKWRIQFKSVWYTCKNFSEALLSWIRLIVEEFQGQLFNPQLGPIPIKDLFYDPFFEQQNEL